METVKEKMDALIDNACNFEGELFSRWRKFDITTNLQQDGIYPEEWMNIYQSNALPDEDEQEFLIVNGVSLVSVIEISYLDSVPQNYRDTAHSEYTYPPDRVL